jgi:hypothetical protein
MFCACYACALDEGILDTTQDLRDHSATPTMMMRPGEKPTLHEILMAEKMDFEAKVQRAAKRKKWLKGLFCPRQSVSALTYVIIYEFKYHNMTDKHIVWVCML